MRVVDGLVLMLLKTRGGWVTTTEVSVALKLHNGQARRSLRRLAKSKLGVQSRQAGGFGVPSVNEWKAA